MYFVYGNWDGQSEYGMDLPRNFFHLHQRIEQCGEYYIAGFSGCATLWGNNPIYEELQNHVREKHSQILEKYNSAQQAYSESISQLNLEVASSLQELLASYPDKGRKYDVAVRKIENRESKARDSLYKPVEKVMRATAFTKYLNDQERARLKSSSENRKALFGKIKDSGIPQDKLILVTHARLFRLADDGLAPLLHVFGHVHEFKLTRFKGTWYLNAAALDSGLSALLGRKEIQPEGYCIVEFCGRSISVERRSLLET